MKTFNEFVEMKLVDAQINECAALFAETDIDAEEYLTALMEGTDFAEGWGDWLKGVGNKVGAALGRWGTAAGQLGRSVVDGGVKYGYQQAADTVSGPAVKFDKAVATLEDLVNFLNSRDDLRDRPSADKPSMTIAQYINGVLKLLRKEKNNIPKMQQAQVTQNYAPRGGQKQQQQQQGQMQASPIIDPNTGNPFMKKVI